MLVVSWVGVLLGWLLVFVRQSVSCLDNRLIGEFAGCLVGELGLIVCL